MDLHLFTRKAINLFYYFGASLYFLVNIDEHKRQLIENQAIC